MGWGSGTAREARRGPPGRLPGQAGAVSAPPSPASAASAPGIAGGFVGPVAAPSAPVPRVDPAGRARVWSFPRRARVRRPTPAKISAAAFPPSFNCPPNRRTAPPSSPSFLPALPIRPSDVRRARAPRVTAPPISRTALPARVAARPARSPSVAIRRSFFAAGPACRFRNRYVSANPERIQRTQSRTPRSHGRGFRIQARIASRPGGVSSSGSYSVGAETGSSERRSRIGKGKRTYRGAAREFSTILASNRKGLVDLSRCYSVTYDCNGDSAAGSSRSSRIRADRA